MSARFHASAICLGLLSAAPAQDAVPGEKLAGVVKNALSFLQSPSGTEPRSVQLTGSITGAEGALKKLAGGTFKLDLQPPAHFRLEASLAGKTMTFCQNGDTCWIQVPDKKLLIKGDPATPRFGTRPDSVNPAPLNLFRLPVSQAQLMFLPTMVTAHAAVTGNGDATYTLTPAPATAALDLPVESPSLTVITKADPAKPTLVRYADTGNSFTLSLNPTTRGGPLPETTWQPRPDAADRVETVSPSHLDRFLKVTVASLTSQLPSLPPATGERHLVASAGAGRLEQHDGTRVLFLAGSPEEMGRQHGLLLKKEIRRVVDRILYGVGVGSSFEKGRWFFGEIEEAVRRTTPFIDPRHLAEMDAIAAAAGLESEEVRLANYFPELFHCSGFALLGKATAGGRLFHGRVLDYLRGVGLEENAVVIVSRPDQGNAWVNISYAGFIGSVTAMNEKQLSIGEMGGRGEGNWDGKPMAQLVREVMEKCSTIDEVIDLMRRTPRTCEYYYVIADAKSHRACGIKATPDLFEVVATGESHPELSDPVADTVLLSGGSRYEALVKRVKDGFGKFDAPAAIHLMTPPVCMKSNIHSVLFAPDTLDFWVANADSKNVASETRYTAYNLRDLLKNPAAAAKP